MRKRISILAVVLILFAVAFALILVAVFALKGY